MASGHYGKAFHGGEHYENFPVGSWLVPKPMRQAVLALYRFARTGDDLADEGQQDRAARHAGLDALRLGLTQPDGLNYAQTHLSGELQSFARIGAELRNILDARAIDSRPAQDLIAAFVWDVDHAPMTDESEVLRYCSKSANPIGRLVLAFAGLLQSGTPANVQEMLHESDAICTGLQLANFAQDMGEDLAHGRSYAPLSWGTSTHEHRNALVLQMADWGRKKIDEGSGLAARIRKTKRPSAMRLGLEIALVIEGGREIIRMVQSNPAAVWQQSPSIPKHRLPVILLRAIRILFAQPQSS